MMNTLRILLLFVFLCARSMSAEAQQTKVPVINDSLPYLLDYFYGATNDAALRQNIEKAQQIVAAGYITDSLAAPFIDAENIMLRLIGDSSILNRHPFKENLAIAFANLLVRMFEPLPPGKENLWYAAALNNLGMLLRGKWLYNPSDTAQVHYLFETSRLIRKKLLGEKKPGYAESLQNCSVLYQLKNENGKAKSMMLRSLAILRNAHQEGSPAYADNLYMLANLYKGLKNYDSAMLLFDLMAETWRKIDGEESSHYALWLYNTGEMMTYLWQYHKAFDYYQQALAITEKTIGKNNIQYAYCLEGVAGYFYIVAEYDKAIPLYLQSLAIKEKLYGKEYYDIALTLHNLATTYFKMGRYEQAMPCFQKVISIQKESSAIPQNYAYELNWQGSLYQSIGNYSKALSFYEQAIEIPGYSGARSRYAGTLNNIASVYAGLGENKHALTYLEQSRSIIKNNLGEQSPDYAAILYNIAVLHEKSGLYKKALQPCRESLVIRKKIYGEMHPQYALCLHLLGSLYLDLKKTDSAEYCLMHALAIQEQVLGKEHPDYIKTLNSLSVLNIALNNYHATADLLTTANNLELKHIRSTYTSLSEDEKMAFETDQYYQFSYLPSLIYKNHINQPAVLRQIYTNELSLKGMVLNDQRALLSSIRNSNDSAVIILYNDWRVNKLNIGKQLLQPAGERSHNFDSILNITNQQGQELSRISATFRQQYEILTTKSVFDKLHDGEAAIEFIRFQYYDKKWTDSIIYAALVLTAGDSIPKFVPLFEEKELLNVLRKAGKNENAVNRFYSQSFSDTQKSSGNALYLLTWKPLEKYLSEVHTVYYAPAGLLHRIAFGALPVDASHRLIDRYHLSQMLSTRGVALPVTAVQKPLSINIWGDIDYDLKAYDSVYTPIQVAGKGQHGDRLLNRGDQYENDTTGTGAFKWPALYGTRMEMDSIEKIFAGAGNTAAATAGTLATEEKFKAMDGGSPPLLHVATHGFFWPEKNKQGNRFSMQKDPMLRSGLVLAGGNGIWNNNEPVEGQDDGILTAYEIAQLDLSNTYLVVLSACETALGDLEGNEGVIGLQRAFKIAGVKQIIMSLWRVPDQQTAELMSLFYNNWLGGQSTQEALRSAQLFMKSKYPPYDWAGFVLVE